MVNRWTRRRVSGLVAAAVLLTGPGALQADAGKGEGVYRTLRCSMCHKIDGAGGKKGPDLSDVGSQRDYAWLEKYLRNPKSLNPKNTMPPVKASPQELEDLIHYLQSLKKAK